MNKEKDLIEMVEIGEKDYSEFLIKNVQQEEIKNPLDQDWRKRDHIIMENGFVVNSASGVTITNRDEIIENIKDELIKELGLLSKINRGLYSGIYQNDEEYIKFCDEIVKKNIEDKSHKLAKINVDRVASSIKNIIQNKPVDVFTKPVKLCSNPISDEFLKIDLDKEICPRERKIAQESLVMKEDPDEPIELSYASSKHTGRALLQSVKNVLKKDEIIEKKDEDDYEDNHINFAKIKETVKKSCVNKCGEGVLENAANIMKEIKKNKKATKKTMKKKVAKKKVTKKKVKKNDRK